MTSGTRFSDVALLISDATRVILLKPSEAHREVLRVCSAAVPEFNLRASKQFVGFDDTLDGWVLLPGNEEALTLLRGIIEPAPFTIATSAPKNVQAVIAAHLKLQGVLQEYCAVAPDRDLPPNLRRLYERLGSDGYLLLGAMLTFGRGRSAFRLASRSYLYHRNLETSQKLNDDLVRQTLAWNIISQSYVALENFCAMLSALQASRTSPATFAQQYLRFGHAERDVRGPNVTSVMSQILGCHGPDLIANALGIPVALEDLEGLGLSDCGIGPQKLVDIGRRSRELVHERFRELAHFVIEGRTAAGGTIKSVPVKAYGAFRHGFATAFPLHLPNGVIMHGKPEHFSDELDFLEYENQAYAKAEIMFLGDPDTSGLRKVETVRPIVYSRELKPFLRAIYRTAFWTFEMAKCARSLFGSRDMRFPYLINASSILSQGEQRTLQGRIDALEGMS